MSELTHGDLLNAPVEPRIESTFDSEREIRVLLYCPFENVSRH